jgi:protein-tyrosine phosphatase
MMKKVLFVCLGNICRSPVAEGIFKKLIKDRDLDKEFIIDSAGTIGFHEGELPDERMSKIAKQRGYALESRARKFNPHEDFEKFDYIIAMDDEIFRDITRLDRMNSYVKKIFKMADFVSDESILEVADPYYGNDSEFELVIEILENGSRNLLEKIETDIERNHKK